MVQSPGSTSSQSRRVSKGIPGGMKSRHMIEEERGLSVTPVAASTSSAAWCHHILAALCSLPVRMTPKGVASLLVPLSR